MLIGSYSRFNDHALLMTIGGYAINGYWWLLMVITLVIIDGYFINGYCGYFINGYWWLSMAIILMVIGGYYRLYIDYWWVLYYKLLLVILCHIITIAEYYIISDC
jgi:hypothetical protein